MDPLIIALNIIFSGFVFTMIVGGLLWAVLGARGKHRRPVARASTSRPEAPTPHPRRTTPPRPAHSDRDPAVAV